MGTMKHDTLSFKSGNKFSGKLRKINLFCFQKDGIMDTLIKHVYVGG